MAIAHFCSSVCVLSACKYLWCMLSVCVGVASVVLNHGDRAFLFQRLCVVSMQVLMVHVVCLCWCGQCSVESWRSRISVPASVCCQHASTYGACCLFVLVWPV